MKHIRVMFCIIQQIYATKNNFFEHNNKIIFCSFGTYYDLFYQIALSHRNFAKFAKLKLQKELFCVFLHIIILCIFTYYNYNTHT